MEYCEQAVSELSTLLSTPVDSLSGPPIEHASNTQVEPYHANEKPFRDPSAWGRRLQSCGQGVPLMETPRRITKGAVDNRRTP